MNSLNINTQNPFGNPSNDNVNDTNADADTDTDTDTGTTDDPFEQVFKIHLRVKQRNARQKLTTLSGLPNNFNFKMLSRKLAKKLCCRATIKEDPAATNPRFSKIMEFTGDQRHELAAYLVEQGITDKGDITIHGY